MGEGIYSSCLHCVSSTCFHLFIFSVQLVLVELNIWGNSRWTTNAEPCSTLSSLSAVSNTTKVKVILPSVGQTGTSSICDALRLMGYRVYHIEETALFARRAIQDNVSVEDWAQAVSRCRLEVIALEPNTDVFPVAMQASPDAKVILTWRDFASRAKASKEGGSRKDMRWGIFMYFMTQGCRSLPYVRLWDELTGDITRLIKEGDPFMGKGQSTFTTFMFVKCYAMGYVLPENNVYERGVFKVNDEEAYLAHLNEIRTLTPPSQLFEFDTKRHGWNELSQFVSAPIPARTNSSLPHTRSKNSFTNDPFVDHNPNFAAMSFVIFLSLHIVSFVFWRWFLCRVVWCCILKTRSFIRYLILKLI